MSTSEPPRGPTVEYPGLRELCWSHFHQDWFATEEEVLRDVADNDPQTARPAAADATKLLGTQPTEAEIADVLGCLSCNVDPTVDGQTWHSFLEQVARLGTLGER